MAEKKAEIRAIKDFYFPDQKDRSVYLSKYKDTVSTKLKDPEAIAYAYETDVLKNFKKNYYGLKPIEEPPEAMIKSTIADDIISGIKEAGRGAGATLARFAHTGGRFFSKVTLDAISVVKEGNEYFNELVFGGADQKDFEAIYDKYRMFDKASREVVMDQKKEFENWLQDSGLAKDADDGLVYDISSGFTSLLSAMGMSVATGGAGAGLSFGVVAGQQGYEEALEAGASPDKATAVGVSVGAFQGITEAVGLKLFKKWSGSSKWLKRFISGYSTEGLQEGIQDLGSDTIKKLSGISEKTWKDVAMDGAYSAFIGGIVGGTTAATVGGMVGSMAKRLEKEGVNKNDAAKIAIDAAKKITDPETQKEILEAIKIQNSDLAAEDYDINKQREKFVKSMQESATIAEQFLDIKKQSKKNALMQGYNQEQAEVFSTLEQARAINLMNNGGLTPVQYLEDRMIKLNKVDAKIKAKQRIHDGQDGIDKQDALKPFIAMAQSSETAEEMINNWEQYLQTGVELDPKINDIFEKIYDDKDIGGKALEEFFNDVKNRPEKFDDPNIYFQEYEEGNEYETTESQDYVKTARGYVKFDGNQTIINILEKGDESTLWHEMGHVFLNDMQQTGGELYNKTLDWLGSKDGKITRDMHEKFADTFVLYLKNGEAPAPFLQQVFRRLRNWLKDVYNKAIGAGVEVDKNIKNVFDELITPPEEIQAIKGDIKDILQDIESIRKGDVELEGVKLADAENLLKQLRQRLPARPEGLLTAIRKAGGIKKGTIDLGQDLPKGIVRENGEIDGGDLSVWMQENGFIVTKEAETYRETGAIQEQAESLIEQAIQGKDIVRESDQDILRTREAIIENKEYIQSFLARAGDIEEVVATIKRLRAEGLELASKEQIKNVKEKINKNEKDIDKLISKVRKSTRENIENVQTQIIEMIEKSGLPKEQQAKFLRVIKNTQSRLALATSLPQIQNRIKKYYEQSLKRDIRESVHKELKTMQPTTKSGVKEGKYDYTTNKLAQDLWGYEKLNKEQAEELLNNMMAGIGEDTDVSVEARMRISFLTYKTRGMQGSLSLFEKVLTDIKEFKRLGKLAKDETDLQKKLNRAEVKDKLVGKVRGSKANKESLKTKIGNLFRRGFSDWESMIESIFGKEVMEEMSFLENDNAVNNTQFQTMENIVKEAQEIYDESRNNFVDRLAEMNKEEFTLFYAEDMDIDPQKISKMQILDMYLQAKNPTRQQEIYKTFTEEQYNSIVSNLTPEDILFGEMMQSKAQGMYDSINEVFVKTRGIDLPQSENYWMQTTEHYNKDDLLLDNIGLKATPGFVKQRSGGIPKFGNAYQKMVKHVSEMSYYTGKAEKFMELSRVLKDMRVEKSVTDKFGKDVYGHLFNLLANNSLDKVSKDLDLVSATYNKVLNNWTVAKIGLNPVSALKQWGSMTNFSVNMSSTKWAGGFLKGLTQPRKTLEFMMENSPMLKTRFAQGGQEAIQAALDSATKLGNKKMRLTKALTYLTRISDVGAIVYGGYPYVQHLMKQGHSKAEAFKIFEKETNRDQQSGFISTRSTMQENNFFKPLMKFRTTANQYLRKISTAIIRYQNGDSTKSELSKALINYLFIQPLMYTALGTAGYGLLLGDWGDEEEFKDSLMVNLTTNPFAAIPIMGDALNFTMRKQTELPAYQAFNIPLLSDLGYSLQKANADDITLKDFVLIMAIETAELGAGVPVKTIQRYYKKLQKK